MTFLSTLPGLYPQDMLTLLLAAATMFLLLIAHAANGGRLRQVLCCASMAIGALTSLSLFGLDIGF